MSTESEDRAACVIILIMVATVLIIVAAVTHCVELSNGLRAKCVENGHAAEDCAKAVHN